MTAPTPVRLLLVIDEMEVGGTQRQMLHLARSLEPRDFALEVVYFRFSSFIVDELKSLGVRVHHCAKHGRVDPGFFLALRGLIRRGHFDIVHAFSFSSELWCALALRTLRAGQRPAFLSSVRGTYEWYTRTQWQIKRWVSQRSQAIVANSVAGADYAAHQTGIPRARFAVIANGMPLPTAEQLAPQARLRMRADMGLRGETVLVLFVGRLVADKNVETLLAAFAMAVAGHGDSLLRLALVGDGPLRAELVARTQALGITELVHWLGERRDAQAVMHASDMLVLPSWREGLSNVILEAMLMGKPVLASRAGGNAELVVPHETGLLFEPADRAALAAAIRRLASDAALVAQMGEAGREHARARYGLGAFAAAMAREYRQALDRRSNRDGVEVSA